jgi:NADPH-dependent 2,4-dienoyl-CoA reductase/sulfur reductase-like enzyme
LKINSWNIIDNPFSTIYRNDLVHEPEGAHKPPVGPVNQWVSILTNKIEAPRRKQRGMFCRTAEPTGNAFAVAVQILNKHLKQEIEVMSKDLIGSVMVVGGGIAGMQAALDLADSGYYVYLVEKGPSIGGAMSQLDKTFPTNDCAM